MERENFGKVFRGERIFSWTCPRGQVHTYVAKVFTHVDLFNFAGGQTSGRYFNDGRGHGFYKSANQPAGNYSFHQNPSGERSYTSSGSGNSGSKK